MKKRIKKIICRTTKNTKKVISIVDNPAIQFKGLSYSDKKDTLEYIFDDYKQIIAAPLLIPDKPIIKKIKNEVVACIHPIEEVAIFYRDFMKNNTNNITFMHTDKKIDAVIDKSFIIEDTFYQNLLISKYNYNLPIGSIWVELYIENLDDFLLLKNNYESFSLEGMFELEDTDEYIEVNYSKESIINEIPEDIQNKLNELVDFKGPESEEIIKITEILLEYVKLLSTSDANLHPNCRCKIEKYNDGSSDMILHDDACDECRKKYNDWLKN